MTLTRLQAGFNDASARISNIINSSRALSAHQVAIIPCLVSRTKLWAIRWSISPRTVQLTLARLSALTTSWLQCKIICYCGLPSCTHIHLPDCNSLASNPTYSFFHPHTYPFCAIIQDALHTLRRDLDFLLQHHPLPSYLSISCATTAHTFLDLVSHPTIVAAQARHQYHNG